MPLETQLLIGIEIIVVLIFFNMPNGTNTEKLERQVKDLLDEQKETNRLLRIPLDRERVEKEKADEADYLAKAREPSELAKRMMGEG